MINWDKFSPKSLDFIFNSDARLNIAHGAVRSAKTSSCDVRWIMYCLDGPPGDLIMVGKTLATLRRNVLNDIFDTIGPRNYKWINRQQGELLLLGRRVHLVGAHSEDAEGKIRGATLAGALCDEVSLYPQSFWDMLMTRLSVSGAMCFATCNPGNPNHWFYRNVILNNEITNKKVWHFTLDDNPNLTEEYRRSLEEMFTGVFYDRMVRGLWVAAEGAIYQVFADNRKRFQVKDKLHPRQFIEINIGVDFGGGKSGHAFVATGITLGYRELVGLKSKRYVRSNQRTEIDPEKLGQLFIEFCQDVLDKYGMISHVYCDSAEQTLIAGLRTAAKRAGLGWLKIGNALKTVINDRIRATVRLMAQSRFRYVEEDCETLENAFLEALWNPKNETDDERLDDGTSDIDTLDGFEYTFERLIGLLIRTEVA